MCRISQSRRIGYQEEKKKKKSKIWETLGLFRVAELNMSKPLESSLRHNPPPERPQAEWSLLCPATFIIIISESIGVLWKCCGGKALSQWLLINLSPLLCLRGTTEWPHFSSQGNGHRKGLKVDRVTQPGWSWIRTRTWAFLQSFISYPMDDPAREPQSKWV